MILIVDCGSQKTPFIEDCINELDDYLTIPLMELNIDSIESCQGIVFSGAPLLITEINMEIYLTNFQWIKELKIPILGICFGPQLLGLFHG